MAKYGMLLTGGLMERTGHRLTQEMQVVALTSQKGGSGKTTMTGHLAVQAARTGNGPVAIVDTDPQGSIAGWGRSRDAERPVVFNAAATQMPAVVQRLREEGFRDC